MKEYIYTSRRYDNVTVANTKYIIGADIGGTNANFGIFKYVDQKLTLTVSFHFKSKQIATFTDVVLYLLALLKKEHNIVPHIACVAAAGVVSENRDSIKLTNLPFVISSADLFARTDLTCIYLTNDFEIIGYGIDVLLPQDFVCIHKGQRRMRANKAVLGAGTGLGKCLLVWNDRYNRYIPSASEGGHADAVLMTNVEREFELFVKKSEKREVPLSWEDVLSGSGIKRIHQFFSERLGKDSGAVDHDVLPDDIFKNREQDDICYQTYKLYAQLYGRCAKNLALDMLALGGIYIVGGIAAQNAELFYSDYFLNEFFCAYRHKELLQKIPMAVVTDYNVSLYGAAQFLLLEQVCVI